MALNDGTVNESLCRLRFTQLEQNITSVNLQEMAAILNSTAVQVQQFEPNVSHSQVKTFPKRRHVTYYFIRLPILYGTMPSSCHGYKSLN